MDKEIWYFQPALNFFNSLRWYTNTKVTFYAISKVFSWPVSGCFICSDASPDEGSL